MDDARSVVENFLKDPNNQDGLVAMIDLVVKRRDLFPYVDPRESNFDIAKRCANYG